MKRAAGLLAAIASLLVLGACNEGDSTLAVGTLELDRIDLVAEAPEPVVARPVAEGGYVEAGALLLKLDPTRLESQVAEAAAGRALAEARLAELVRGPRRERIAEARARLQGADGSLATARKELARMQKLVAETVASAGQLDQQRARFDEALAARDAARAGLDALLEGTTLEELAQAEAALAQADAALANARLHLARLEVRAPSAGWLDALPYELGERPPAGAVVAVLLVDAAPYARVYVPAAIRVRVTPGTPASVRVDGIAEPLPGRVRHVATDASFTPYFALTERDRGRLVYLAKVDLQGPDARGLPTGIPVEVEFQTDATEGEAADAPAER